MEFICSQDVYFINCHFVVLPHHNEERMSLKISALDEDGMLASILADYFCDDRATVATAHPQIHLLHFLVWPFPLPSNIINMNKLQYPVPQPVSYTHLTLPTKA